MPTSPAPSNTSVARDHHATDLRFHLNGRPVRIREVSPTTLLVDYLRSAEVGLTGTKIGCKQGGCGACTVLLSQYDPATGRVTHRSINSCLRPLASLDGMLVTTVEGMGSVDECVSPPQYCLAKGNGTQCGYCTPGWIMSAHGCLAARGVEELKLDTSTDRVDPTDPAFHKLPTRQEVQERFDGNLCRCTGYRPILHGFEKGFARDWTPEDDQGCMTCEVDPAESVSVSRFITPAFPPELKCAPRTLRFERDGYIWIRPTDLLELREILARHGSETNLKLVFGNTSIGVYDKYVEDPRVLVDIAHIPELSKVSVDEHGIRVGASVTYNDFLDLVTKLAAEAQAGPAPLRARLEGLLALQYLTRRTAGAIVRDAASLGGNTMLVLRHIDTPSEAPFPSDLFTALMSLGARARVLDPAAGQAVEWTLPEFVAQFRNRPDLRARCLLLGYVIPFTGRNDHAGTYKAALREVNAHSIVNAGFKVRFGDRHRIAEASVVYAGIAPVAVHYGPVEKWLHGREWNNETLSGAIRLIGEETRKLLQEYAGRYAALPSEGFTDAYRCQLAESFFYQFFIKVALAIEPARVPTAVASAGIRNSRPVSKGTQSYQTYAEEMPVSLPYIKLDAFLQATGEAVYPQDIPIPARGLQAAYVTSTRANASFWYSIPGKPEKACPDEVLAAVRARFPGVVDFLTYSDLPVNADGSQSWAGFAGDQPLFAQERRDASGRPTGSVAVFGQSIGLVLAEEEQVALDAAHYISTSLIQYGENRPVLLTIDEAKSQTPPRFFPDNPPGAPWYSHIWKVFRIEPDEQWAAGNSPTTSLDGIACRIVRGSQIVGSQIHFYMETQTCVAEPGEEQQMVLRPSTQDPDTVHSASSAVLQVNENKVDVRIKRIGGGYGGKCTQPAFPAAAAALAAAKWKRVVRLALPRETDTAMFGHRHAGVGSFTIAIGTGEDSPANRGRLMGLQNQILLNGGWTYDCSLIVMDCLQLRADGAYFIPHYGTSGDVCKTNTASSTAFRTMGLIQGLLMQEEALEKAAHSVGMLPEDVRQMNLYKAGDSTPYQQKMDDCYIREVFDYTRKKYRFDDRLQAVRAFNAANRWRKRGISLVPLKYASGYNLKMLEQAGAFVEIFSKEGSILVRTGGVDMGQGLNTKLAQVAAYELRAPLALVRVAELDTAVVPNPTSTGASTGTGFNGEAVKQACETLRKRLQHYCVKKGPSWCQENHIVFNADPAKVEWSEAVWPGLVSSAFTDRENLSAQVRVKIQGGTVVDAGGLAAHPGVSLETVNQFTGFTYSAAIAEVEIDVLTGETAVLRADLVYDIGKSLNPAIDVGQIEGGFVQGIGYVLYEERVYQADGPNRGALNTLNTWTYKPPAVTSIPIEMNVDLFPFPDKPVDRKNLLLSSKEVGEPPMTLAATVFFATKHAIHSARQDRGLDAWFPLEAPATVQRIREACAVSPDDLRI